MEKPIISKEHFVACINVLRDSEDMARRINKIVYEYGRGDFIDGYGFSNDRAETKLIETLELALNDISHYTSWFCFNADFGRDENFANIETGVKIHTPEELYDFIVNK